MRYEVLPDPAVLKTVGRRAVLDMARPAGSVALPGQDRCVRGSRLQRATGGRLTYRGGASRSSMHGLPVPTLPEQHGGTLGWRQSHCSGPGCEHVANLGGGLGRPVSPRLGRAEA